MAATGWRQLRPGAEIGARSFTSVNSILKNNPKPNGPHLPRTGRRLPTPTSVALVTFH